jgi:hypothetical protein
VKRWTIRSIGSRIGFLEDFSQTDEKARPMKYTAPRIEKIVNENELALEAAYAADTSMTT